jgi:hypothetical protein
VIVSRPRHDDLVDALAASVEATRVGSAFDLAVPVRVFQRKHRRMWEVGLVTTLARLSRAFGRVA